MDKYIKNNYIVLTLIIGLVFLSSYGQCAEETVNIRCLCLTAGNPSECTFSELIEHEWDKTAFSNPDIDWSDEFLKNYCMRNKSDVCQCDGEEYFSGIVMD